MKTTNIMSTLGTDTKKELSVEQLACALYEGMPHVQNLAEKLARQHGGIGALPFYDMCGEKMQAFWIDIAQQMIDYAKGLPANPDYTG